MENTKSMVDTCTIVYGSKSEIGTRDGCLG
jgi:hypothetical protein